MKKNIQPSVLQKMIQMAKSTLDHTPVDVGLLGAQFQDADWLQMSSVINRVASAHEWVEGQLHFDPETIQGAQLPNRSENLFAEFNVTHTLIPDRSVQRIGVHVVSMQYAQHAPVLRLMHPDLSSLFSGLPTYALVIYLDGFRDVSLSPFGVTLSVSSSGGLKNLAHFPLSPHSCSLTPDQTKRAANQVYWLVYLLFSGFALLHTQGVELQKTATMRNNTRSHYRH